jgi:hypothetical protein
MELPHKINLGSVAERVFLLVMFSMLLHIGYSNLSDHALQHGFPYSYLASDSFQHQTRAEALKDAGNFRYEAPYISMGFEGVVGRYPPVIYHLAVIFSYLSGLEVYDAIYFLVFLLASLAALVMYFIVRGLNRNIALLSLPFSILIFAPGSYMGFLMGHWPSITSQLFLLAFFWALYRIELRASFLFLSAFASGMALTHTSEFFFGVLFLAFFLAAKFLAKNLKKGHIKTIAVAGAAFFIASLYYLIIFKNTWAVEQSYSFNVMPVWEGNPALYIGDFGVLLLFLLAGMGLAGLMLAAKKTHISFGIGFAMLLMGYTNYIGFDSRAFQIRFFWPIYLSAFFGLAIYKLSRLASKKWSVLHSIALSAVVIALLSGIVNVPYVHHYERVSTPGLMDAYHWEMLNWFHENSAENESVYFFYGDIYSQDALLRNSKRVHQQVDPGDFVDALKSREIRREYVTEFPGDSGGGMAYRRSFFKFGNYRREKPKEYFFGKKDICNFDYYVFDKIARQPVLAQYNMAIANELLKNDFIRIAFENEATIILKNNKPGVDCIEERKL